MTVVRGSSNIQQLPHEEHELREGEANVQLSPIQNEIASDG
jgi:hypothetical protein